MTDLVPKLVDGVFSAMSFLGFLAIAGAVSVLAIIAALVFFVVRLSSANARMRERWREHDQRERPPLDPRGQLVGVACVVCDRPCMTVLSAAWCDHCDGALHHDCRATHLSAQRSAYR